MSKRSQPEENSSQQQKANLLPKGEEAREIIRVLVAMYRAMYNPEGKGKDSQGGEHADH